MDKIKKPVKNNKAKVPKKKQVQPKHHVGKSKAVVAARREKIVKAIMEGMTQQAAGEAAGLNPNSAYKQVSKILQEPSTQKTFLEFLNEAIPDDFHSNVYREGMEANKVISANVIAPGGEGMKEANSMTKDFIEVPDHPTRIKAADSVSKLKGLIVNKEEHTGKDGGPILLSQMSDEELEARARAIINQRR
jgi:hypothetical protein